MIDYYEDNYDFLKSFHSISREIYDQLYRMGNYKKVEANTKFVDIGDIPNEIFLLNKGVVRSYVILENGKELTKNLFASIDFFSSLTALTTQSPSEFIYESLTECHVFSVDYNEIKEICEKDIEVFKLYARALEFLFTSSERNHLELASFNAKQRYLKLRERIPEIDNLIPQYQIAYYLNITSVQLSRIRSKLYQ